MAKFKVTLVGNTRDPRIVEAYDCQVYEGAATFIVQESYEYIDFDDKKVTVNVVLLWYHSHRAVGSL